MSTSLPAKPRSLLRRYLVAGYAAFIIYASLTPFLGWQEQGLEFWAVLTAPLGLTYTGFDALSNLLAYFPFGVLLAQGKPAQRQGCPAGLPAPVCLN